MYPERMNHGCMTYYSIYRAPIIVSSNHEGYLLFKIHELPPNQEQRIMYYCIYATRTLA